VIDRATRVDQICGGIGPALRRTYSFYFDVDIPHDLQVLLDALPSIPGTAMSGHIRRIRPAVDPPPLPPRNPVKREESDEPYFRRRAGEHRAQSLRTSGRVRATHDEFAKYYEDCAGTIFNQQGA